MSSADGDSMERRANEGEDGGTDQAVREARDNTTFELTPAMADTIAQKVFEKLATLPRTQLPQRPTEADPPQNPAIPSG